MNDIAQEIGKEVFEALDKEFSTDPTDGITVHTDDWRAVVNHLQDQARAQHGADSNEPVAWGPKPTKPGRYIVRGFDSRGTEALVCIADDDGDLVCNLHDKNSEQVSRYSSLLSECSDKFEWAELHPAPLYTKPPANQVPNNLREILFGNWPGCSDHGCIVTGPKKGMGTNGGCHCLVDASRSQLQMLKGRISYLLSAQPDAGAGQWMEGSEPPYGGNWIAYRPRAPKESRVTTLWYDPNHNGWSGNYDVTHYMEKPQPPQTQGEE